MIIDSSGKGRKVWKSEVIGPAVIDPLGGPHVGSFRVDGVSSKQTNYTKICFIKKNSNTIRVLIGLCKFWVHGSIVLYRISWYTIRNRTIKGFYCIFFDWVTSAERFLYGCQSVGFPWGKRRRKMDDDTDTINHHHHHLMVLWHSPESNFSRIPNLLFCIKSLKIILFDYSVLLYLPGAIELTHWGWVMHICISN